MPRDESGQRRRRRWRFAPYLLVCHLIVVVALVAWSVATDMNWEFAVWDSQNAISYWLGHVVSIAIRDLVLFYSLGFLVACSFPSAQRNWGRFGVLCTVLSALAISLTLAIAARVGFGGLPTRAPSLPALVYVVLCCSWGSWSGGTWRRARTVFGWCFSQVALFVVAVAACTGALVWFGLDSAPLDFAPATVETEDRRRLVKLFRENDPRDIEPGAERQVTFAEQDINQLFSWGLGLGESVAKAKAQAEFDPDSAKLSLSFELPEVASFKRFLNVTVAGKPYAENGELVIHPRQLQVGRIAVPPWLLKLCGPSIFDQAWKNKFTSPFLSSLRGIQLDDNRVTIAYGHVDLPEGFARDALISFGGMEDMAPATSVFVQRLLELAENSTELSFGQCLQTAFAEAKQRSVDGDPIHENRAAILALGYLLGHSRIKMFVGAEVPSFPPHLQRQFRGIAVRGRQDWTRHFAVSAALEVFSNVLASQSVGLLKEELDADGGSGFSFPDLVADRAGTKFAETSTRSATAARAMQDRLAGEFQIGDYFPPAADLPEGLTDAEVKEQFGGVGGDGYNGIIAEIDQRIADCEAYSRE